MTTHIQFGKYEISIRRLKDNILSVRTEKKNHTKIKSALIGNDIKDLLLDYQTFGKFDISSYNKMGKRSKEIMDELLLQSGMDDKLGIRITNNDLHNLLERYELLRGGIMTGNDSKEVRDELKKVVLQLVRLGKLPLKKSYDLLLELCLLE